jgi:hypothetical protein
VGDVLEHLVAGRMAVGVVDLLEVVDVDHQHQRRLAGAGDAVDLAGQHQLEVAAIGEAGERDRGSTARTGRRSPPAARAPCRPRAGRQRVPRLLQQLQRRIEIERVRFAGRGVGGRGHSGGSKFGSV